jgi:hypothetical protein
MRTLRVAISFPASGFEVTAAVVLLVINSHCCVCCYVAGNCVLDRKPRIASVVK